ncbi:hypothetical protein Tco_0373833 [Tanacetum coccineum]
MDVNISSSNALARESGVLIVVNEGIEMTDMSCPPTPHFLPYRDHKGANNEAVTRRFYSAKLNISSQFSHHCPKQLQGDAVFSVIEIEPSDTATSLPVKKVHEMEAVIMVNVLRQAGADVVLASIEHELEVRLSGLYHNVADVHHFECF